MRDRRTLVGVAFAVMVSGVIVSLLLSRSSSVYHWSFVSSGVCLAIGGILLGYSWRAGSPSSLDVRIRELTNALAAAASTVSEIEDEVQRRGRALDELRVQVDTQSQLKNLTSAEIAAVKEVFDAGLRRSNRLSLLATLLLNIVFFALGLVAGRIRF